jgi:hypothetical protein
MDQVGEIFALDHTVILKTRDGVISQLERPSFDSSKPALEAGEVKRILLARVDQNYWAWRLELSATAFRKNENCGVRHGHRLPLPFQRRSN